MNKINIKFYGQLSELTGTDSTEIKDVANSESLNNYLLRVFPLLKGRTYCIAVNNKMLSGNIKFNNGDSIAIMPPFSGG